MKDGPHHPVLMTPTFPCHVVSPIHPWPACFQYLSTYLCISWLRDKTRPSRIPPLGPEVAERVMARTLADPPGETTHWTADMMAQAAGVSDPLVCASSLPRKRIAVTAA